MLFYSGPSRFYNADAISLSKYSLGRADFSSKDECVSDWLRKCSRIVSDDASIPKRVPYDVTCGPLCCRDISWPIRKMCIDFVTIVNECYLNNLRLQDLRFGAWELKVLLLVGVDL